MNTSVTMFDDTGRITLVVDVTPETLPLYMLMPGSKLVGVRGDPATQYVESLALVEYAEAERAEIASLKPGWVWQMPERVAVDARVLTDAKARKNAEINQKRLEANRASFVFATKTIARDELSMLDIASANGIITLTGEMPPNWPGGWKAVDNTYVAIPDKATWIAFYGAMVQTGTDNFNRAQTLKTALAAATTNAAVDSIEW